MRLDHDAAAIGCGAGELALTLGTALVISTSPAALLLSLGAWVLPWSAPLAWSLFSLLLPSADADAVAEVVAHGVQVQCIEVRLCQSSLAFVMPSGRCGAVS